MFGLNKNYYLIYLSIIILNISGCISLNTSNSNDLVQPVEPKNQPERTIVSVENDAISDLIQDIPTPSVALEAKIIGYVNTDLLDVFPKPNNHVQQFKAINHISRGSKILIFETNGDWANISADIDYPFWVNLEHVCFTDKCWLKNKALTSEAKVKLNNRVDPLYKGKDSNSKKLNSQVRASDKNDIGKGYKNVDGKYIPSPQKSIKYPPGATAACRDGTWSFSQNRRGTCSHHGGVASWL